MEATLEAVRREGRGKNEANRLRAQGKIPAVVYGTRRDGARKGDAKKGDAAKRGAAPEAVAVAVDPKSVLRILHSDSGANTLINLTLDGTAARVMLKEYQLDPVTHALLHADFYQLAMDKAIVVTVPIRIVGEAKGVKLQGGIIDFVTREIEVESLPTDIPENIEIDVTELALHESIRVRDLVQGPKWKAVTDGETMIAHVVTVKAEEAPAAAPEAAPVAGAAEPEVIKKGKTEKEEEPAKK